MSRCDGSRTMKKTLLLLVPLIAVADSSVKKDPFINNHTPLPKQKQLRYPYDYTLKERINIDKLSSQLRLFDRTMYTTQYCTPKYRKLRAIYRSKYYELQRLDPNMTRYNQLRSSSNTPINAPATDPLIPDDPFRRKGTCPPCQKLKTPDSPGNYWESLKKSRESEKKR